MKRITVPPGALSNATLTLDAERSHYLTRVLRMQVGSQLSLVDGAGMMGRGWIETMATHRVELRIIERCPAEPGSGSDLTLFQAVGKADKMDVVVRFAGELGVRRLVPFLSKRTVARREKSVGRWERIAEDALRITGRPYRMMVSPVIEWPGVLKEAGGDLRLAAVPPDVEGFSANSCTSVGHLMRTPPPRRVDLLVGPEGGLDASEICELVASGWRCLFLGPYTLRTEVAGPAAVAALQLAWGEADVGSA
ncbi:MAG: RsmE family RNA methyltransferase [Myxococcota bacterium]